MVQVLFRDIRSSSVACYQCDDLKGLLLSVGFKRRETFSCYVNNHVIFDVDHVALNDLDEVMILPRVCGGKGGFGSMLRAIGAQIEATTNNDACRDLSGKRLRDVKCEQMMKEWQEKKRKEKDDRKERKKQRIQRVLEAPSRIKAEDNTYITEMKSMSESVETAIASAMSIPDSEPAKKRKLKPSTKWLGDSDDSSESDEDGFEEDDGPSTSRISSSSPDLNQLPLPPKEKSQQEEAILPPFPSKEQTQAVLSDEEESASDLLQDKDVPNLGAPLPIPKNNSSLRPSINKSAFTNELSSKAPVHNQSDDAIVSRDEGGAWREANCKEALLQLGGDALKQILADLGLKCGGTVEMRAERLFSVRNLDKDEFPVNLLATSGKNRKRKIKEIIDR